MLRGWVGGMVRSEGTKEELGGRAWTDGREQGVLRPPDGDGRWKPS